MTEREELEGGIAALEAQRAVLGDAVVDTALAALRARLARLDVPEQQLKPVTILFADVVESTRLSRRLEPEDVQAVMDGALRRFTSIVESQHGRVFQYAGDGLLAVFGAVESREDDPERAVRAGLGILDETRRLAAEVQARHESDVFNVRVGIHTGPVLLGGGVDAEGSVRGITVNIAARMEQTAPAGGLRISRTTYRHVRGLFDIAEEPPILLKGISDPLRSYVVLGARPAVSGATRRGVEGVETPLIGRDAELARLIASFEAVSDQKFLSLVTVIGDAGLGKTRLMTELERRLEERTQAVWLFHGLAQPSSTGVPYGLLRALLGERFEILDDDTQAVAHAKLADGFGPLFGERSEEMIALIGQLIGLDYSASPHIAGIAGDGQQLRDRAFRALTEYFRMLVAERNAPILVLLDDLHWADDGSLDFIDYMAQACRDLPIMMLCLTRPALDERWPGWGSGRSNQQRIDLLPLSRRSSHQLLESLLSRLEPVPSALYEIVTNDAEGNPYFIEELVAMLIDHGVIITGGDRWRVAADRLVDVPIPSTLAGVLQARLDGLPPAEKRTLQLASVIGHVFWDDPLQGAAPGLNQTLESLRRRDLIRAQQPSSFEGAREYAFKHHLLHQVTYDGVLRVDKRHQHRLTAEWLVARSGERSGELYGVIAEHYEGAADSASAADYWHKAGDVAAGAYATDAALTYLGRALDLTPPGEPALRYELIRKRVTVLNLIGRRREEESGVSELERLADRQTFLANVPSHRAIMKACASI
jgi:class 3 adenylate cyclase